MAGQKRPTQEDRDEAVRLTLLGLITGEELAEITDRLADLHPRYDTFPGEELLELGAQAIEASGATMAEPIEYEAIRERYLPEFEFKGKAQHHRSGVEPGDPAGDRSLRTSCRFPRAN